MKKWEEFEVGQEFQYELKNGDIRIAKILKKSGYYMNIEYLAFKNVVFKKIFRKDYTKLCNEKEKKRKEFRKKLEKKKKEKKQKQQKILAINYRRKYG